ncbi:hypothetical protein ACU4GD_22835 [Cupriavidus basilensis]
MACARRSWQARRAPRTRRTLTIAAGAQQRNWTREALLNDRRLTDATVDDDNLKQRLTFKAIPLAAPLRGDAGVTADAGVRRPQPATATFPHLPMRLLLADSVDGPRAWLAVENPDVAVADARGTGHRAVPRWIWTVPAGRAAVRDQ